MSTVSKPELSTASLTCDVDIKFVTTDGDLWPTPENSTPISDGDDQGRGSLVWFNQASMYQASETQLGSVKEAKNVGHPGTTDYGKDANQAFTGFAAFKPAGAVI